MYLYRAQFFPSNNFKLYLAERSQDHSIKNTKSNPNLSKRYVKNVSNIKANLDKDHEDYFKNIWKYPDSTNTTSDTDFGNSDKVWTRISSPKRKKISDFISYSIEKITGRHCKNSDSNPYKTMDNIQSDSTDEIYQKLIKSQNIYPTFNPPIPLCQLNTALVKVWKQQQIQESFR